MYQDQSGQKQVKMISIIRLRLVYVQSCDVNYTPDTVKSFEGGAPTK